jgi:hypothetical protein
MSSMHRGQCDILWIIAYWRTDSYKRDHPTNNMNAMIHNPFCSPVVIGGRKCRLDTLSNSLLDRVQKIRELRSNSMEDGTSVDVGVDNNVYFAEVAPQIVCMSCPRAKCFFRKKIELGDKFCGNHHDIAVASVDTVNTSLKLRLVSSSSCILILHNFYFLICQIKNSPRKEKPAKFCYELRLIARCWIYKRDAIIWVLVRTSSKNSPAEC